MKKLVLFAVAVVAISFASCGNKANTEAATAADSTVVTPEPEVAPVDTVAAVDTTAAVAE